MSSNRFSLSQPSGASSMGTCPNRLGIRKTSVWTGSSGCAAVPVRSVSSMLSSDTGTTLALLPDQDATRGRKGARGGVGGRLPHDVGYAPEPQRSRAARTLDAAHFVRELAARFAAPPEWSSGALGRALALQRFHRVSTKA